MPKSSSRSILTAKKGLTLVEVVVSMAIVTLTLLTLWEGFNLAFLANGQGEENDQVAIWARDILDGLGADDLVSAKAVGSVTLTSPEEAYDFQLGVQELDRQAFAQGGTWGLYEILLSINGPNQRNWQFYRLKQVLISA